MTRQPTDASIETCLRLLLGSWSLAADRAGLPTAEHDVLLRAQSLALRPVAEELAATYEGPSWTEHVRRYVEGHAPPPVHTSRDR